MTVLGGGRSGSAPRSPWQILSGSTGPESDEPDGQVVAWSGLRGAFASHCAHSPLLNPSSRGGLSPWRDWAAQGRDPRLTPPWLASVYLELGEGGSSQGITSFTCSGLIRGRLGPTFRPRNSPMSVLASQWVLGESRVTTSPQQGTERSVL